LNRRWFQRKHRARKCGYGKDAPWKSPLDFPTLLGNPAKAAGFPLSTQPLLLLTKHDNRGSGNIPI
jgi:hypothetical protein